MTAIEIGQMIAARRKRLKLSQQAAADAAGISQGHWADVERGRFMPTIELLQRVAEALQCTLDIRLRRLVPR